MVEEGQDKRPMWWQAAHKKQGKSNPKRNLIYLFGEPAGRRAGGQAGRWDGVQLEFSEVGMPHPTRKGPEGLHREGHASFATSSTAAAPAVAAAASEATQAVASGRDQWVLGGKKLKLFPES